MTPIHAAILWHQHQPLYREWGHPGEFYRFPWVRLHAVRDYYPMAALAAGYPSVHLTINLTPALLTQIEGYVERGATDRALELTRRDPRLLDDHDREELLGSFFDADWHNQIYSLPRYRELFEQRVARRIFSVQDLTDLQACFNLAWFAPEFLQGATPLHDGTIIDLAAIGRRERDFTRAEIDAIVGAQMSFMRNVIPIHAALQRSGQLEITTSPFYHPILPLIQDTNQATIDRPGASLPERFSAPEDAAAQVQRAARYYRDRFGMPPRGMWPAEGAVGAGIVPHFVDAGLRWIASDEGVLARSGRWGYRAEDPAVRCQPYRTLPAEASVAIFFRDRTLSDSIGFSYQAWPDQSQAAAAFVRSIKDRGGEGGAHDEQRVVSIILDGENAWGSYSRAARPFLHALYGALASDPEICTVTFCEYLDGNPSRGVAAHPPSGLTPVHDLFTGSWIDESGSAPGVDLGTWIGEEEENLGWHLLGKTREDLLVTSGSSERDSGAWEALFAAEGSDWFWWFGADQESGMDDAFDDLFRNHLAAVYAGSGQPAPAALARHIVPRGIVWTFSQPVSRIATGDRLVVRTNCAGEVHWWTDVDATPRQAVMVQAGGVMAGLHSYSAVLGPFSAPTRAVSFRFECRECACQGLGTCCGSARQSVDIGGANRIVQP